MPKLVEPRAAVTSEESAALAEFLSQYRLIVRQGGWGRLLVKVKDGSCIAWETTHVKHPRASGLTKD